MAASSSLLSPAGEGPEQADLDKCVHCGLCLNVCPTYRVLGLEMDSPRGRIYQINQVANGSPVTSSYTQHLDLCLACRACETACPSGVPYGRIIESARAALLPQRKSSRPQRIARKFIFEKLLVSRAGLQIGGAGLYLYRATGLQRAVRSLGILKPFGKLAAIEALAPTAEIPFFYRAAGKTFPAHGPTRYRVAFLAGCIANVSFARLNEATVRVLQRNGCEVTIPADQNCCGALHLHSGMADLARQLAKTNIEAFSADNYDAVITNAAGCGSTLKEYGDLLSGDASFRQRARTFSARLKDVNEFLASIDLSPGMAPLPYTVTYQDSCHLAHGQKIKDAPRKLLRSIPALVFREMPMADLCCGSAGVYNVVQNSMAMQILESKMKHIAITDASVIATANPGCMLQLSAGARLLGKNQRVVHVVELLDEAYEKFAAAV